jgi:hypothetical protein
MTEQMCVISFVTNPKFNASMNNLGLILVVHLHVSIKRLKHKDLSQKNEEISLFQQFILRILTQIMGSFIISI